VVLDQGNQTEDERILEVVETVDGEVPTADDAPAHVPVRKDLVVVHILVRDQLVKLAASKFHLLLVAVVLIHCLRTAVLVLPATILLVALVLLVIDCFTVDDPSVDVLVKVIFPLAIIVCLLVPVVVRATGIAALLAAVD
jgi:hypothetical protein